AAGRWWRGGRLWAGRAQESVARGSTPRGRGQGSGRRLDLALGDPLVVGHGHVLRVDVDHVDGLLRVTVDGRVGAVHAGHVVGAQAYLAPLGPRRGARVLELLVHDPLVVDPRPAPGGPGAAVRAAGGVEPAGDGAARTARPR